MKVVAGDFPTSGTSWALSDRFIFGDKKAGEKILYAHIEEIQLQEETKKGSLVKIVFLDGRRLLCQLTEDEYLRIRGALFDVGGDIEDRRAAAIAHSDEYKVRVKAKQARQKQSRLIALAVVAAVIAYNVFMPGTEKDEPATDPSTIGVANTAATSEPPAASAAAAAVLGPVASPAPPPAAREVEPVAAKPKGTIADGAVEKMTKAHYPKAFQQWGQKGMDKINSLAPKAAQWVVGSGTCDRLELIGLSERSRAPNNIVFFADCKNGMRFYVTEADIKSGKQAVSKNEKTSGYSENAMIELCTKSVQSGLHFPSSFDADFGGTTVYRAPGGNVVVNIDFEAKNRLGNLLPHAARCVFDDQGMSPPEVSPR